MAQTVSVGENGARVVLTDHFLDRARERVSAEFIDIPNDRVYRAARRYPNRKCRALVDDRYWIVFKFEQARRQVVYLTLMPKDFILPEPSIWVAL